MVLCVGIYGKDHLVLSRFTPCFQYQYRQQYKVAVIQNSQFTSNIIFVELKE